MASIKRSMSVRPSPIDTDGNRPRYPTHHDTRWGDWDGGYRPWEGPWGYVITRVTNSTDYKPGWHLTKAKVDALIADEWTVSVLSKV